ncbi:MAG: alanine--tRNA ligase [Archaeoglobaceae archaeon]|nr:alanine--tRNA ligase [Archaeoglobaceae archaeon]MCX8152256.1 alanine--tRNA ligase [Archaeoglobaceae archaeon]
MLMSIDREYLDIKFLPENGFVRKRCPKCGKYFWTADESREICGDPPCGSYRFIGNPVFKKSFEIDEMREFYLNFFEKRGHERIERYPVIARWREDIYLTIASIADFQPFVTSGIAPPPANPLTISQPCIRLDDLDDVGRSGRHLTLFEMMAHHAFNYPGKEIYWKDETVSYCTELLGELGVRKEDIVYKEEPWAGGGNAGPCLEAIVAGLELATLVFMNLVEDKSGDIEIKGSRYKKMENYIVDTGYGLERFVWASKGTPTIYDAIFSDVIDMILENSYNLLTDPKTSKEIVAEKFKTGVVDEKLNTILSLMEKAYALADHSRCILFMLGDGLVPSNSGAGYLARLMIRRSLRMIEELGFKLDLFDLVEKHYKNMKFEFEVPLETVREILELEKVRYKKTMEKGIKLVERLVERKKKLSKNDFVDLYDSHGIPAELAIKIAKEKGINFEIPSDFYAELAKKHSKAEKEEKVFKLKLDRYPKTKKLFYEDPKIFEFEAEVLGFEDGYVVLDRTAFYPESGGQESDSGYLKVDGKLYRVQKVIEVDGIVLHKVDADVRGKVLGVVDLERRLRHMRHHSATHILLYTLQKVLGKHVWQAGAKKEEKKARLDVTHFKRPNEDEIRKIEALANKVVLENKQIRWFWMDRIEAEKKFGFRLYQGGVPPGREIRIVQVGEDVQACGGTHCSSTGEIGMIKVLRVDAIQDGVIRFEFAAGESALEAFNEVEKTLKSSSEILRVDAFQLPKTVEKFFEEWKEQKKEIEKLQNEVAELKAEIMLKEAEEINSMKVIAKVLDLSIKEMIKLAEKLASKGAVGILMSGGEGKALAVTFSGTELDARKIFDQLCKVAKGSGGGKKELVQGAVEKLLSEEELYKVVYDAIFS